MAATVQGKGSGVSMDTSRLDKALKEFAALVKDDGNKVVLDEARKLYFDAMNMTPPYGERDHPQPTYPGQQKPNTQGSTKKAQAQGQRALQRDIRLSMAAYDLDSPAKTAWEQRIRESGKSVDGYNEFFSRTGRRGVAVRFNKSHHTTHRKKHGLGRLRDKKPWSGKWLVTKQDQAYRDQYIRHRQRRVGTMKAAYAIAVTRINQKAASLGLPQSRIPAWVRNNMGKAGWLHHFTDINMGSRKDSASVEVEVNSHAQLQKAFPRAMRMRATSLERNVRKIVQGNADKVNGAFKGRFR